MPEIDSLSIEITAKTESAEQAINRLIGTLERIKTAVSGATKLGKNIRNIAGGIVELRDAANSVNKDAGDRLINLAGGLDALSKVRSLSKLNGAGKIISEIAAAAKMVNGDLGAGLEGFAAGVDALAGVSASKGGSRARRTPSGVAGMTLNSDSFAMDENVSRTVESVRELTGAIYDSRNSILLLGNSAEYVFNRISGLLRGTTSAVKMLNAVPNWTFGNGITAEQMANAVETNFVNEADRFRNWKMSPLESFADTTEGTNVADRYMAWRNSVFGEASNTSNLSETLNDISDASNRASIGLRNVGKAARDAGDSANKGNSGISKFLTSLKRIAYYRFIRMILREISQAFKEGATNLYQWSKATGLSDFSKNMDRIATSALYLKNSLGAMLEPIVRILTPIIEWVTDALVWIIDKVTQFFAALSGAETYTAAKKVATTWSDASDKVAGSTKKAADYIKRTILGFDEINKLEKQNTSLYSGSSGSKNNGINVKDMFEKKPLQEWALAISQFINKFNIDSSAVLGGLLAGFVTIKLAIKACRDLSLRWLKDMAGATIKIAVSLVRAGWETIKKWAVSFGEAVVDLAVRIKTRAVELWAKFAAEWAALHPVLQVGIVTSVTAAALWAAYKIAWALAPNKVLEIKAKIVTAAAQLKNDIISAWNKLEAWKLGVQLRLETYAITLKEQIVNAWNKLPAWALGVGLRITTSAATLKAQIENILKGIRTWLIGVGLRITTSAETLKDKIMKAWNGLGEWALGVKASITTSVQDMWNWLKDNWEKVAAVGLGVAVAIITPWETLAAALSGLWADVMASFGGALAFSVVPTLGDTGDYGISTNPTKFKETQEAISKDAAELRGKNASLDVEKSINPKLAAGIGAAVVGVIGAALMGNGYTSSLASVFLPNTGGTKKSELSPSTAYYNNQTGELVIPKSVDITANITCGKGIKKVSGKAITLANINPSPVKVNGTAGTGIDRISTSNKLNAFDDSSVKINGSTGTGLKTLGTKNQLNEFSDSNVKVHGVAGSGLKTLGITNSINELNNASVVIDAVNGNGLQFCGAHNQLNPFNNSEVTVDSKGGVGLKLSGTNTYSLTGIEPATVTVNGGAGTGGFKDRLTSDNKYQLRGITNATAGVVGGEGSGGFRSDKTSNGLYQLLGIAETTVDVGAITAWADVISGNPFITYLGLDNLVTTVTAQAVKGWIGTFKSAVGADDFTTTITAQIEEEKKANRPKVETTNGVTYQKVYGGTKALGGSFFGGRWHDIPQFANGTANAHGSLFVAGEAGPEIVGHVGGRTEVLNKSQLASAMFEAVRSAMAPAVSGIAYAAESMGALDGIEDMDALLELVRRGSEATERQNELLLQQNEYLRSINDKDFTAEISTADINKAQRYANKRHGQTLVPVTT